MRSAAAVVRAEVVCSATGETPADPAGRGHVPVERADVGAVAARRTLDDLAIPEPERDVAYGSVAVAEEDEVAKPVPARGRIGTDATGNLRRVRGCVGTGQEASGRPL